MNISDDKLIKHITANNFEDWAFTDEELARLITLVRIGAAVTRQPREIYKAISKIANLNDVEAIELYHVERIIKHLQNCIDNFYATEHMPQFNWSEWKDILTALKTPMNISDDETDYDDETVQQRNMRMGWGCKCHGETFCPDMEFSHYEDDQPVFRKKVKP